MAKDGTMRGGARAGSGRKAKAVSDKGADVKAKGSAGRRKSSGKKPSGIKLTGNADNAQNPEVKDYMTENADNEQTPEVKDYMTEEQKCGEEIVAAEVFEETWQWLKARGCEKAVSVQLVRNYAMSVARWVQCEHIISKKGFLSKHPTTGQEIASPFVTMAQNYMKQINNLWYQIFQIVKENSEGDVGTAEDAMEQLLRSQGA